MTIVVKDLLLSGHDLNDYQHMFDLNDDDLQKKVITCASGFDSFNAEMTHLGHKVVSCARNYDLGKSDMLDLIANNLDRLQKHVSNNLDDFLLADSKDLKEVEQKWTRAATLFLNDYEQGQQQKRYRADVLPSLQFDDYDFDIALCSHFLFSLGTISEQAHIDYIKEMARVAKEVRLFPLNDVNGEVSDVLGPVMLALQQDNYFVEVRQVDYEFQRGGNAMLRAYATKCDIEE